MFSQFKSLNNFDFIQSLKIWQNIMLGGKKWLKGDEKKGENSYFHPQLVKSMLIFPPNWLIIYKIKKKLKIIHLRRITSL